MKTILGKINRKVFRAILLVSFLSLGGCKERTNQYSCQLMTIDSNLPKNILRVNSFSGPETYKITNEAGIDIECAKADVVQRLEKCGDDSLASGILYVTSAKAQAGTDIADTLNDFCIRKKINLYEKELYNSVINHYCDVLVWASHSSGEKIGTADNMKTLVMPGKNATVRTFCITRTPEDHFQILNVTYTRKEFDEYLRHCDDAKFADGILFEKENLPLHEKTLLPYQTIISESLAERNVNVFVSFGPTDDPKNTLVLWLKHKK